MVTSLLLIALLLASTTGPNSERLDELRQTHAIPGMAVVVVHDGLVVFSQGYGWADIEAQVPVTPDTPFRIASLTKPLAAALLLRLNEQGRLDLDAAYADNIKDYDRFCAIFTSPEVLEAEPILKTLTEDWHCAKYRDQLTVRHYLTHTAQGEPGAAYRYNGFLFGQLDRVAEFVTAQSFGDLVTDSLLVPLNMKHSLSSQSDESRPALLASLAVPYHKTEDGFARSEYPSPGVNAGAGVISTVLDLAAFDTDYERGAVVSSASRDAMMTPARSSSSGEALPYGLGWFVQDVEGEKVIWHYGWQPGAYSGLWLKLPDRGVTIILLANSEGLSAGFNLGDGDVTASPFARFFLEAVASD